jgi:hypothetical protein
MTGSTQAEVCQKIGKIFKTLDVEYNERVNEYAVRIDSDEFIVHLPRDSQLMITSIFKGRHWITLWVKVVTQ